MSKLDKLKARLFTCPKDFTWDELITVLKSYGYEEIKKGKTGGSRRKFKDERDHIISLHEPHPKNILKSYAVEYVVEALMQKEKELDEKKEVGENEELNPRGKHSKPHATKKTKK